MAYYSNLDDDEDKDSTQGMNNPEQTDSSAPISIGSQSASGGSEAPNAAPVKQAAKAPASGTGPSFQNYSKANQGIAQQRLNNAAASNVANQGKQATTAINQSTTAFGQRVENGTLANRQNAVQDVTNVTNAARGLTAAPVVPQNAQSNSQQVASGGLATPVPTNPNFDKAPEAVQQTAAPVVANPTLSQDQTNRFSEVINAQYKGPESLRQAGLYQLASGKVGTAQNTLNNTKTAAGREDMLKQMYQQRGDYTAGQNKLDTALLNASKQGVQAVQDQAKAQGNVAQKLDRAQIDSATLASNRTNEINKIKEDARTAFSSGKTAEEAATEKRLDDMLVTPVKDANGNPIMKPDGTPMTQWDQLPESFREIIRNKKENNASILASETGKIKATPEYGQFEQQRNQYQNVLNASTKAFETLRNQIAGANASIAKDSRDGGINSTASEEAWLLENAPKLDQYKTAMDQAQANLSSTDGQKAVYDKQFKDLENRYNPNAVVFNPLEAALIGVGSGEGFYNLGENAIVKGIADREKLVSRDEQLRQSVLAQLAGLDQSNRLDTNLRYDDAALAGTQSVLDSLDLENTRKAINEAEDQFQTTAEGTKITGKGKKKVSRGNAWGTTTRTYNAKVAGQAADFLKKAGYDFDSVDEKGVPTYSRDLLEAAAQASESSDNSDEIDKEAGQGQLAGTGKGAAAGATAGSYFGPWGTLIGGIAGAALGGTVASGTLDFRQHGQTLMDGFLPSFVGDAYQKSKSLLGDSIGDTTEIFGSGISDGLRGALGGTNTDEMKKSGEKEARKIAIQNLKDKYAKFLSTQGFANRADIANTDLTTNRLTSLEQLLANLDKTNT